MVTKEDIIALTNIKKRKEFINGWEQWPLLVEVPELDLVVRREDLPDGSAICASFYEGTADLIRFGDDAGKMVNRPRFCLLKPGKKFRPDNTSESYLVEHLMGLRTKLKGEKNSENADAQETNDDLSNQ